MSNGVIRETTTQSWGKRMGNAFGGVLIGLLLCCAGPALHWWNEGRTVNMIRDLEDARQRVIEGNPARVNPDHEGKLIHLTAVFEVDGRVADPDTSFEIAAARLKRTVEMFQWEEKARSETQEKLGGTQETTTEYTYVKTWKGTPIRSADFKSQEYSNPPQLPLESRTFDATTVRIGEFTLSGAAISRLPGWEALAVDEELRARIASAKSLQSLDKPAQISGEWIYLSQDPVAPQIGDLRLRYEAIFPKQISLIAGQSGISLQPFATPNKGQLLLVTTGQQTAGQMIDAARSDNTKLAWILRGVGALLIFVGLNLIARPLAALAAVVPFLGRTVGFLSGIVAFFISIAISVLTIGAAWLAHRPVLGISLLLGALAIAFFAGRSVRPKPAAA